MEILVTTECIALCQKAFLEMSCKMINEQILMVQEALNSTIMNNPDEDQIKDIYNA